MTTMPPTGAPTGAPSGIDPSALEGLDLSDHTSYANRITAVTIAMLCLVVISVPLRIGVRLFKLRKMGLDDCKSLHPSFL